MKQQNKEGPALLGTPALPREYGPEELTHLIENDSVIVVDTRHNTLVHEGTVPGSLNIPGSAKAASYGSWVVNPDTEQRPLVVLAPSQAEAAELRNHLVRVGIDTVEGYITSFHGLEVEKPPVIAPEFLKETPHDLLLDVRNATEYAQGHIPGARQLSAGRVMWHHGSLPKEATIISYCQSGVRNSVAASALRREGYSVVELQGSYAAWSTLPENTPVQAE